MTTADELYSELKQDIVAVADPLFEFSAQCLRKRGNFLPHSGSRYRWESWICGSNAGHKG
jgi:hypothetical protein